MRMFRKYKKNMLKNPKEARLFGEVVGHLQQLDDVASYHWQTLGRGELPHV
jgi:hypothetical protein